MMPRLKFIRHWGRLGARGERVVREWAPDSTVLQWVIPPRRGDPGSWVCGGCGERIPGTAPQVWSYSAHPLTGIRVRVYHPVHLPSPGRAS
jgi:hypothetical protein